MQAAPQPEPEAKRLRYWLPRLSVALIVPLLALGLIEGGLKLFRVGYPTEFMISCTDQGQAAYCNNLYFTAPFFPGKTLRTPRPFAFAAVKPKNTFRIFVVGESAAFGDPDPAYGFSRFLEVMLRERFPSMQFEVINTGITAIDSHVELPMVRDLARYQPDLFVIYTGNNEVVGPYGAGTVFTPAGLGLKTIRASVLLRRSRIGQLLTRVTTSEQQKKQEWRGMEMFLDRQVRADSPLMPRVYENFAANLSDMVDAARESGAKVVLSTVATNLKDCAPFGSQHRPGISQNDLERWSELASQGQRLEGEARYAEALKTYEAAETIDDSYAELQFRIARMLEATGDHAAAKEHFAKARDLDTLRFRTDSAENAITHKIAEASGADLLDAEALFAQASANGITGSDLLYEHVHLTPKGNYLIAAELFRRIAKMMPQGAGGNAQPLSEEESEQLLALTPYDRARIATDMFWRLQKPPFTNQSNHQEQLFAFKMAAEANPGDDADTNARYLWALQKAPQDRMLHLKYSVFLLQHDRVAAADHLRKARPFDGFPLMLPDGTRVE